MELACVSKLRGIENPLKMNETRLPYFLLQFYGGSALARVKLKFHRAFRGERGNRAIKQLHV